MMSTVAITTPAQGETPLKTEAPMQPQSSLADKCHRHTKNDCETEVDADTETHKPMKEEERMPWVYTEPVSEEEAQEQQKAATIIQSVYRGYQTRRDLYGSALTASQKWRYLIDHSRIELIHKRDAIDHQAQEGSAQVPEDPNQSSTSLSPPCTPNDSKTRWAWRRAEFLGSRLGKGSNGVSTEEALVLLTEHWLEMSDKKHRYGSNLKVYHQHWLEKDTSQNFFYWLDKGDGKEVDIAEKPRARLEEQRVRYLQEHERSQYAVEVIDGLLYYKHSGLPVHTLPTSVKEGDEVDVSQILPDTNEHDNEETRQEKKRIRNKSKFIYVTDPQGVLYIAQKVKGQFHHSSFLGGGTVCAAGGIIVNQGKLMKINPKSGHYRPGQRHFDRLLGSLEAMGISLDGVVVSAGILEAEIDGDGNEQGRQGSSDRLKMPLEKTHLGLTLLGHVPGIVYAWWIIYTNREDPRTRRRINHHDQNNVNRRSYLAVAQQGLAATSPPSSGGIVPVARSHDPQVHTQSQTQTHTTQTPGLPHQDSQRSSRTVTTTTTTRTSSNGGPAQTTQTTYTTQDGEVIVDKKDIVIDKKDVPPAY
ncbi:hypothetical protein BGZ95_008125 [Linnemannia exigua]|uniref:IQ calmodulin-binding motif protein n=1 Tax=Linnemannia exigua TaxID=604196 RepID=A0AAD4H7H7_9FUNG|nr:hypothetical protein BGZ95_008125 [Linnemannia exigua]